MITNTPPPSSAFDLEQALEKPLTERITLHLSEDLLRALKQRCHDEFGRDPDFSSQLRRFLWESLQARQDCFQCVFGPVRPQEAR